MKLSSAIVLIAASVLFAKAETQQVTPAEQRIAAARQQIASDPKKPEAYNNLALAFISRAHETASPDYDRQAAEAIATGLSLAPQDFQLRKAHVALLLDQHEFGRARDEAKDLNLHNPDDATVHGYLARAYLGLGDYQHAETSAQWMLNLQPFNVPGLLIAADLREHYGDPEGALEVLDRAYAETSPGETGELAAIANHIAAVEISMGKLDSASQMLQRADELFPGYPETLKNRARVGVVHPAVEAAAPSSSATHHDRVEPAARGDKRRHLVEHLAIAAFEHQAVDLVAGDDHELREIDRIGAFAQYRALGAFLPALRQETAHVEEIGGYRIACERLRRAEGGAVAREDIADLALGNGHQWLGMQAVLERAEKVEAAAKDFGLIPGLSGERDQAAANRAG